MGVRLVKFPMEAEMYDFTLDHSILENRDKQNQHPISAITGLQDTLYAFDLEIKAIPNQFLDSQTIDFTKDDPNRTLTASVKVVNSSENALEIRKNGLFVDKHLDLDVEDTEAIHLYFENEGETLEQMYNNGNVFSHCRSSWLNIYSQAEADAWYFDTTKQSILQPLDTSYLTGFVSNIKYRTYTHKATLISSDNDNDINGLVIAYVVDSDSKPHTLSCVVERGSDFVWQYALVYDLGLPDEEVLFTEGNTELGSDTLSNTTGWSNSYITMEVKKQGTIVSCAISDWDSTTINPATTISIDLGDYIWGSLFTGKVQYGYCTWSQANSYFTNVVVQGNGALKAKVTLSQDENNNIEIREDGLWCQGGGGSAASSILEIEQEDHQLQIGDPVYCDTNGLYKKSYAEDTIRIETIGLVTEVVDENNFIITISGQFITDMFNSYSDGTVLYLSDTQVGKLTDNPLRIFKPIAIKIQDSIIINIQRANYYRDITEEEGDEPQNIELEYYTYQEMQEIIDEIWDDNWEGLEDYDMLDYKTLPVGALTPFMGLVPSDEWLLCDGSEYNIDEYNRLADYFTGTYGSPNYFGGDGITTFAVPDTRERYFKGSDTAGTYTEAGLPNITGEVEGDGYNNYNSIFWGSSGALYTSRHYGGDIAQYRAAFGSNNRSVIGINASRSNAIYGNSNTVTPKNISVLYCIKAK